MINIQNESSLHNTLKLYYATKFKGKIEVESEKYIYDIVCPKNHIIEIQTQNLSSLYKKIEYILDHKNTLTLVHPVVIKKTIYNYDSDNVLISKSTSSKKGHYLDIFSELTKIYPFLLHKKFTLKVLEINMIEERLNLLQKTQSKNKRRRYKKNWQKTNKRLENLICEHTIKTKDDYKALLPPLPTLFSSKELRLALEENNVPSRIYNNCTIILWVLVRMGLIEKVKTENRYRYYKFV